MAGNGRYYVRDLETKRLFCVEIIHGRSDREDGDWQNGGIDPVKHRGSIDLRDSLITEENGFKNIEVLPMGANPIDRINQLLKQ